MTLCANIERNLWRFTHQNQRISEINTFQEDFS